MAFGAVVFDMDGVLVDSEHLWEEHWARYASGHGVEWNSGDTATVQGMSSPEWSLYLAERSGTDQAPKQVEHDVVDGMIESVHSGAAPLLPGADGMVRELSARVPIALASSAARRVIDAVLDTNDLTGEFTTTVSSSEVPRGKPSPDVYLEAASRLGRAGSECLGVEDSSNGIRAAAAAGLAVIALPNPSYPPKPDAMELAAAIAESNDDVRVKLLAALAGEPTPVKGAAR